MPGGSAPATHSFPLFLLTAHVTPDTVLATVGCQDVCGGPPPRSVTTGEVRRPSYVSQIGMSGAPLVAPRFSRFPATVLLDPPRPRQISKLVMPPRRFLRSLAFRCHGRSRSHPTPPMIPTHTLSRLRGPSAMHANTICLRQVHLIPATRGATGRG